MLTPEELLQCVTTDALEAIMAGTNHDKQSAEEPKPVRYPLRLVRDEDGKLEWKDD